ncbi:THUMP domain-containing class I SAM-dependent RNA methyltransferase [Aureibacter tunicatorum]|uniref:N6-adenine-specific DNA methylase n=1 Tax=Aureibacter tunicatorum TaxID=866807 RepID=A0AAE3XRB2_9BACT|nr:THUMP domain-containing protein [Aureibacter tunicatorum]MDR6241323.1 putative N6-adenine-specific DNA methylase [Aureibacter tunicatorum]BDD03582.1 RNA methyltransferase [Aureibacter tunicatorum]
MYKNTINIVCQPKVGDVLIDELKELGYEGELVSPLNARVKGDFNDAMILNMFLRTANKVLLLIEEFEVSNAEELYEKAKGIAWDQIFKSRGYFSIDSFVKNDSIVDTRFPNLKLKDAIVDSFQEKYGHRPDAGSKKDATNFFMYWVGDKCSIYLDTSGATIAKHGYRKESFKAPVLESLASALILSSQWDKESNFINPMCGSGTLSIEAALIALNKAPGLYRQNFGFMHVLQYNEADWRKISRMARRKVVKEDLKFKIIATDHDPEALKAARLNAKYAEVDHLIEFSLCDFEETFIPFKNQGVVFLNPEYGERLGEEPELEETYARIGDFLKQDCQGYCGYIFTGNLDLAKKIGLRTTRRIPFNNGQIECRLLEYELYEGSKK